MLLPEPDAPTMARVSPEATVRLMWFRMVKVPLASETNLLSPRTKMAGTAAATAALCDSVGGDLGAVDDADGAITAADTN